MKTLILYDNTGYIYMQISGSYRAPQGGIQYLEIDSSVHENKIIKSVNVETKEPVLEDIPKSEIEMLKEQVGSLTQANAELTSIVAMGNKNV